MIARRDKRRAAWARLRLDRLSSAGYVEEWEPADRDGAWTVVADDTYRFTLDQLVGWLEAMSDRSRLTMSVPSAANVVVHRR